MTIFIHENMRVIVQGITGREGNTYTGQMLSSGTKIVGGITPGKGGDWIHGKPVFDTVKNAVNATGANTSVILVPAPHAADAIYEATDAGIELIVCITEGIPLLDIVHTREYIRYTPSRMIGPSTPGILAPHRASLGVIPPRIAIPGEVGIVSRSATLVYHVTQMLTLQHIGQSTIVGVGGDPVLGTTFVDVLSRFEDDPFTRKVVMIGEIGGHMENEAAQFIQAHMTKPVIAYVAGYYAPRNVMIGHRSAIIDDVGTDAPTKVELLRRAGARVARTLAEIPALLKGAS
jgi:succinyl-CoA synthetase alpha subunit